MAIKKKTTKKSSKNKNIIPKMQSQYSGIITTGTSSTSGITLGTSSTGTYISPGNQILTSDPNGNIWTTPPYFSGTDYNINTQIRVSELILLDEDGDEWSLKITKNGKIKLNPQNSKKKNKMKLDIILSEK